MKAPSYSDLLENNINPKTEYSAKEKTDNSVFAGWVCTSLCLLVPIFIIGSIICGIKAIEKGFRKEGLLIMVLAPIASLIGVIILYTTLAILGFNLANWMMKESLRNQIQIMEETRRLLPSPGH